MADLYNLQLDDGLLEEQGQRGEEEEQQQHLPQDSQQIAGEEGEEEERERLDLPPALEEAEERKRQQHHRRAADESGRTPDFDDRVDLEDVVGGPVVRPQVSGADADDEEEDEIASAAYAKLKDIWTQELDSPELLPYDEETIRTLTEALKRQEERIDDILTYGGAGGGGSALASANLDALAVNLLRVDADRVKFVICSLLRERLRKIEEHPLHMRQFVDRMSDAEVEYLRGYGSLLERHLHRTVLDHFPQDAWKKLDAPEMIDEPDLDTYVFVKSTEDVEIDNGTPDHPDYQRHVKGTCLIVRYSKIRDLFVERKVKLLM